MLDKLKYIHQKDPGDSIGQSLRRLRAATFAQLREAETAWALETPTDKNLAKQLARECMGRSVLLIGPRQFIKELQSWRDGIRLFGRALAFEAVLPTDVRALYVSFSGQPVDKIFAEVIIRGSWESRSYSRAVDKLERLLSGQWPLPEQIRTPDMTATQSGQWLRALGEISSKYLAVANGYNPDPQKLLAQLDKAG